MEIVTIFCGKEVNYNFVEVKAGCYAILTSIHPIMQACHTTSRVVL